MGNTHSHTICRYWWVIGVALALTGCSAYDLGLEPLKLGAGERGKPSYTSDEASKVKSVLSGAPN